MKNRLYKIRIITSAVFFILSILAFSGTFYEIKFLNIEFLPLLQRNITSFSLFTIILIGLIILTTLIFGRVYCSILCPLGIFQEFFGFILKHKKQFKSQKKYPYKYIILSIVLGSIFAGSAIISKYVDPYSIFSNIINLTMFGIIFLLFLFILVYFKGRFFCTNICPIGAILGLISKCSVFKLQILKDECISCKNCAKNCPTGAINIDNKNIDNSLCIKCFKCLNSCGQNSIEYKHKQNKIKFSNKRRTILISTFAISFFSGAYKITKHFVDDIKKSFQNIFIPAGAKNPKDLLDKCLNCNLCIKNCPTKILQKANNEFNAIHIDFNKGAGYCKYNCNECSKSCPSGAIKNISLEEKQNTKIALCIVNNKCTQCLSCTYVCPKGAIYKTKDKVYIDPKKCIGCAQCKVACNHDAINIFPINS